jgi:predicted dehydrogenase
MSQLRCLIVGMGAVSGLMLPHLRAQPWFALAGVVDPRREALDRAAGESGLAPDRLHTELAAALRRGDADAAIINSPGELHAPQARAALDAGLHVLVAKPMTTTWEDAVALVAHARARGRTLSVAQQIRYNRHYLAVRRFLESGAIGSPAAVFFQNSKPRPNAGNLGQSAQPSLYENSCHHFDSFLALFAPRLPASITCDGYRTPWSPYSGPCMINALIRFDDGLRILYHGGFSSRSAMYDFRIEATKGALRCRGVHMSVDEMGYEVAPALGAFAPSAIDDGIPADNPWMPFLARWHDYIAKGVDPPFSGANNLRVMAMIAAAEASLADGAPRAICGDPRYAAAFARSAAS